MKITMSELEAALRTAKRRKGVGEDEIPVEFLKCLSKDNKKVLLEVLNATHRSSVLPYDFQISTVIPIPKKSRALECNEYRLICLMSHTLKLLLTIINRRIENRIDPTLSQTQFGFRGKKGTRGAVTLFKILIQRALEVNRKIYVCFVDYKKALDRVEHCKLVNMLENYADEEDVRLIRNLYWEQKARIKIGYSSSEDTCSIQRGVRQGCLLSPRLFNLYAEQIMQHPKFANDGFQAVSYTHLTLPTIYSV